jgi:hypothetical protein
MSANFYNAGGKMGGLDLHDYIGSIPPLVWIPVPGKALHAVYAEFDGACADEATRPANITAAGKPVLQGGFKREYVKPHLPIIPIPAMVPHFAEVGVIAGLIAFSGSTAQLKKATVTGAGKPLAVCIAGAFGTNLNCADPFDMPSDLVYNESSVMTEPAASDFAEAIVGAVIGGIISVVVGKVSDKVLGDGPAKLLDPVRKYLEDKLKDQLNEWFNEPATRQPAPTLLALGFTRV